MVCVLTQKRKKTVTLCASLTTRLATCHCLIADDVQLEL